MFKEAMGKEYYKTKKDEKGNEIKVPYELEAFPIYHCIKLASEDYCKIYGDIDGTPKEIYKKCLASWEDSKVKKYLDKHYPILP